ncbi:MAG TPA: zinc-dependent metalloprotease family protein [Pyrinomonadaceae bacterium]|nr:zinc-dependent metalloprotease family protein [Pyrinomonadaceae bacterium]
MLLLIAVFGVFAIASLWPATPPALSASAQKQVVAFTPQVSDALWRDVHQEKRETAGRPKKYRSLNLDTIHLQSLLQRAPREFTAAAKGPDVPIISLPMPDGSMQRFKILDSPIMEEGLAARYPQIRTFSGVALDGSATTTRFGWTPQGFHAILLTPRGTVLIEPDGPDQNYIAYFQGDVPAGSMECNVDTPAEDDPLTKQLGDTAKLVSSGASLRTYRLAVAATAEYTQTYGGGTVPGGLGAVTITVNLVNAVFERDVAVRLVLIANEDQIIFTDTATDGYTSDNVNSMISENQTKLDAVIGSANYDIGHVFDGRPIAGFQFQGLASFGVVCRAGSKARGVNIVKGLGPSNTVAYYSAAHEMGHQFGASHTFNATSGTCGPQRSASTAYEPGTGSTIMGYRFACAPEDMMSGDTYFHTASIEQIVAYSTGVNGGSCPVTTPTGNNIPTVDAGASFTIPQSTPFMLTATASDPDGDLLTYTWEEFDLGTPGPPNTDDGSRPIFRSLAPSPNPARLFPSLFNILCPQCFDIGQSLPLTTRSMKFRATVRDNRAGGGAASSDETTVNVRADAGPFTVNQPGTWNVGTQQTVTWNVANTNNAPVSCNTVRITLSRDGGTFPIVLADNTPNDGSETITVPGTPGIATRIKVEAVGNIFFNVSPQFQIIGPEDIQLSQTSYIVNEGAGFVNVMVTRGVTSGAATVNYKTSDAAGLTNCTIANGLASERCDYATAAGTLRFADGESSKTITIPIVNDKLVEDTETFSVTLSGATGTPLGAPQTATITVFDDDFTPATSNPIDDIPFFVTQQYIDFLGRLPDSVGFANWVATLNGCPNGGFGENDNPGCDRVHVSAGFFQSVEFQGRGYFAYRFYEVALDRRPAYAEFVPDMAIVGGPQSPESEVLSKQAYTEAWTQRPEFKMRYDALSNSAYVNALEVNAEVIVSNKQALIDALNGGQMTRGEVLRNIVESAAVGDRFFNRAFVAMQYFGYLRRDPDTIGFQNWVNTLNADPNNFRHMIFGFLFSTEYRQRFGP